MGRLVTVVLITWNSAPYLRRCLEGIAGQSHRDVELIHIDNASADESATLVRTRFPQCRQIINPDNRGFAAAANQAIREARGARQCPLTKAESRLLEPPGRPRARPVKSQKNRN